MYLTPERYLEIERKAEWKSEYYAGEMAEIATLRRPDGRVVNPPQAPQWDV